MNDAATQDQPMPHSGQHDIINAVCEDIQARGEYGLQRYGTRLQAFNGRDALIDAYQEALDLAIYLKQMLIERDCEEEQ